MIDDDISHRTWIHLSKKHSWFWLICLNYSGIPEFVRELNSHVNGKITSNNTKNWNFRFGESSLQEMANCGDFPGRNGPESGVSQIVRESWQHCHCRGQLGRVGMATSLGQVSLRASSPIWASETSLARFRETHLAWLAQIGELARRLRTSCFFSRIQHDDRYVSRNDSYTGRKHLQCRTFLSLLFFILVVSVLTYLLTKEDMTPEEVNGHVIDVVANGVDQVSVEKKWIIIIY